MTTALIRHADCRLHDMGTYHPEAPARLDAISDRLISAGLDHLLDHHEAPRVTREQLLRAHTPAYVDELFARSPRQGVVPLDPDTVMMPATLEAACRAAGAAVLAVDLVLSGRSSSAFCAVRPPGHHARPDQAMGFCFFNNVAVAAQHALTAHGLERVAIVDFDVHYGNGTDDIFRQDPRVLICQSFQHPFYPYQGGPDRADGGLHGLRVDAPLAAGSGSEAFRAAVQSAWLPALEAFRPQLLLVSAGFDAHRDDPLASLRLGERDYAWVTAVLLDVARRHCQGRLVSTLEGGYDLGALGRCVAEHVRVLIER